MIIIKNRFHLDKYYPSIFLLIIFLIGLNTNNSIGQGKEKRGDIILIFKDRSMAEVKYFGSNQTSIFTKPNLQGEFNYNKIDTIKIINDVNKNLRELVYKVPVKLSNDQPFFIKDLFINELPYSNNGELIFENKTSIKENTSLYYENVISLLTKYAKDVLIYEQDRVNKTLTASVNHLMSTGTREGKYLFFEKTLMKTIVRIVIASDSMSIKVSVNEYEVINTPDFSDNVINSEKLYPNDLFRITNFYNDKKPKKFNNILMKETISIVDYFFRYLNGN